MQKRVVWAVCLVAVFLLAAAAPTWAQEEMGKAPTFIYVAEWAVPRAQWADMAKVSESEKPQMDKLMADGLVTGYGNFTNVVHEEGTPTHGSWFMASSMGNLMKALEAIYASGTTTAPVQAASKHWDHILVTRDYGAQSGSFKGGYLSGGAWKVKDGHEEEFWKMARTYVVPMYEKLLADGVIRWYSVDAQAIHTDDPNMIEFVYIAADASGIDKVHAAIMDMVHKNPTLGPAFDSMVKSSSHHDFLAWVPAMSHK